MSVGLAIKKSATDRAPLRSYLCGNLFTYVAYLCVSVTVMALRLRK